MIRRVMIGNRDTPIALAVRRLAERSAPTSSSSSYSGVINSRTRTIHVHSSHSSSLFARSVRLAASVSKLEQFSDVGAGKMSLEKCVHSPPPSRPAVLLVLLGWYGWRQEEENENEGTEEEATGGAAGAHSLSLSLSGAALGCHRSLRQPSSLSTPPSVTST